MYPRALFGFLWRRGALDEHGDSYVITFRTFFARLLLSAPVVFLPLSQSSAQSATSADSVYAGLVTRLRAGDTTVDFAAMRMAYAHSTLYDPMSASRTALRQRLNAAFGAGDARTAAARADTLLAGNYTDISAHVIRSTLAQQLRDAPQATHHASVARRLVRSLDIEHRGASSVAPILVIDPEEENVYGLVTGLERTSRYTTAQCGQRVCDSTVFHNPRTGRDTTIVFDVTLIAERSIGWKP